MRNTHQRTLALALTASLLAGAAAFAQETSVEPVPPAATTESDTEPAAETAAAASTAEPAPAAKDELDVDVDALAFGLLESDVDSGSSRFEEYRDLGSGFWLPRLAVSGGDRWDGRFLELRARNVRRDDARYTFGYGVAGKYEVEVDYNKIPHRFGNDGRTLHTYVGNGQYQLSDATQAQLQTAIQTQFTLNRTGVNYAFLNNLLRPYLATATEVDLGLQRDRTRVSIDLGHMGPLAWGFEYRHENRKGTRPIGASFGFSNVVELPEPIDHDTTDASFAGEWNGESSGLRFGYTHSLFRNDVSTLYWDNPFRATNASDPSAYTAPGAGSIGGAAGGFMDLWPDNDAGTVFVAGRTRFAGTWYANGAVNYIRMRQDERLLPYTLNSAVVGIDEAGQTFDPTDPANLPARNFDGKVDVLNVNAGVGARFGDRLGLDFRFRHYDYDNSSRRLTFPGYVRYHGVWEAIGRINVPYAYTRQDLEAELGYDLARGTRVAVAYRLESWERELREIQDSDEDTLRVMVDSRPFAWLGIHANYDLGSRDTSEYRVEAQLASFTHPEDVNNLPSLRKYDEAERDVDAWRVILELTPSEALSFSISTDARQEDYDSAHGLLDDETVNLNLDASWTMAAERTLYAFLSRQDRDVFQLGRQSGATLSTNPADDWRIDFDEQTDTAGLGLNVGFGDWTTDLSARWSEADGFADFFSPPGGTPGDAFDIANYEDIEILSLLLAVDYDITERIAAGFMYRWEDFEIRSFITQGLVNYLPGTLLLVPNNGDYQADVFGLNLKLAFD